MLSEKSIFITSIESYANNFHKNNYAKIDEFIISSLSDEPYFEKNILTPFPKKIATNLANEIWEKFKKPSYARSFISKQVYALYCEGNLLYKFWLDTTQSTFKKEKERVLILTEMYDPLTSEERYNELFLSLKQKGTRSDTQCFFQDGKFKTHKLKIPGLQIFITSNIVVTDNLQNIMNWAIKNGLKYKYKIGPILNDPFLEVLIIQNIIIFNAAEYSIIPYFEIGKKKIASLWASLKFQIINFLLHSSSFFAPSFSPSSFSPSSFSPSGEKETKKETKVETKVETQKDFQFNPFEITSETCIFGTKLAGKIKERKNGLEYEYKPNLIAQSKGQIKYLL